MNWEPYDPSWLVELAKKEMPDKIWLSEALKKCTQCCRESRAYIHFVNPERPNKPGSEWQYEISIILEHPKEGCILLDILKDGKIGGIEFLNRL